MVALAKQGLNFWEELGRWLFLVFGGSGIVGFIGTQGGLSVVREKLATEESRHQRFILIGPFGS